jgi:hypothetical protein
MDKILKKDYKRLNRIFEIVQIKYNERPPLAYTRAVKPSIENVTKKKRAGGQLAKRTSKKKKVSASFDSEKIAEDEVDLGLDVDSQEVLSQQACDNEVRIISLVFNSSGLTLPMLTPLGDYFQNLGATLHSGEDVGKSSLSSPLKNIGEDTLPSSPAILASSPVLDTGGATDATTTVDVQMEESEIETIASQETARPSSQRFVTKTPQGTVGDVGATLHVASPPKVVIQDSDLGGGPMETDASKVKAHKGKGTTTVILDFYDSDDDVFDEEVENAWASRLAESTIDVNNGEKVACQLEKGVSTGKFVLFYLCVV